MWWREKVNPITHGEYETRFNYGNYMKDKSIIQDGSSRVISAGFRRLVDSMVEEIVLEGKPFDSQKKYLKKYSENEGIDYGLLEMNIEAFVEMIKGLGPSSNGRQVELVEEKGRVCFLSEETIKKLVNHSPQPASIIVERENSGATDVQKSVPAPRPKVSEAIVLFSLFLAGLGFVASIGAFSGWKNDGLIGEWISCFIGFGVMIAGLLMLMDKKARTVRKGQWIFLLGSLFVFVPGLYVDDYWMLGAFFILMSIINIIVIHSRNRSS